MELRPWLLLVVVAIVVSISADGGTVINVKNYGAHGNGANDDSKVLQLSFFVLIKSVLLSDSLPCTLIRHVICDQYNAAATDGGVEGSVRISWRGDDGRDAGDVLHRSGAVPRPLQGLQLDLPAAGKSVAHSLWFANRRQSRTYGRHAVTYSLTYLHSQWIGSAQGSTLKAATDLSKFGNDWIEFGWVNGLTVTGGTIDGQGAASWPFNKCPVRKDCKVLPTVIPFPGSPRAMHE
jgi:hypothetical protein